MGNSIPPLPPPLPPDVDSLTPESLYVSYVFQTFCRDPSFNPRVFCFSNAHDKRILFPPLILFSSIPSEGSPQGALPVSPPGQLPDPPPPPMARPFGWHFQLLEPLVPLPLLSYISSFVIYPFDSGVPTRVAFIMAAKQAIIDPPLKPLLAPLPVNLTS